MRPRSVNRSRRRHVLSLALRNSSSSCLAPSASPRIGSATTRRRPQPAPPSPQPPPPRPPPPPESCAPERRGTAPPERSHPRLLLLQLAHHLEHVIRAPRRRGLLGSLDADATLRGNIRSGRRAAEDAGEAPGNGRGAPLEVRRGLQAGELRGDARHARHRGVSRGRNLGSARAYRGVEPAAEAGDGG